MTTTEIRKVFKDLKAGGFYEFAYSDAQGLMFSRKEAMALDSGNIMVVHYIDDTETYFTPQGFKEVLLNKRSAWEGDLDAVTA
jgi:hypothetical protein